MNEQFHPEIERLEEEVKQLNITIHEKEEKLRRTGRQFVQNSIDVDVKTLHEKLDRIRLLKDQPEIKAHNRMVRQINSYVRRQFNRDFNSALDLFSR